MDRDAKYYCATCDKTHGGLQCGAPNIFAHKHEMLTRQWPSVLRNEMGPLYRRCRPSAPRQSD
jgi:hypothetical protein